MADEKNEDENENEFDRVIREIDRLESEPERHVSIQLDRDVRAAVRACKLAGKPATVTLKLKVKPGPDRRVEFAVGVASTLPKPSAGSVTLYGDEDGGIHRRDPMQIEMDLEKKRKRTTATS